VVEQTFILQNESGLHARPAALLVQTVKQFPDTTVTLAAGGREVNGQSLLGIMSLGAASGTALTVRCVGPREEEAMAAIKALVEGGFGE
jgi:phosphocarrier protein HPr